MKNLLFVMVVLMCVAVVLSGCGPWHRDPECRSGVGDWTGCVQQSEDTNAFLKRQGYWEFPSPIVQTVPAEQVQQQIATPPAEPKTPVAPEAESTEPTPSCPTEAEFSQLTGVVADKVPTEPCAFHWRGDPLAITPTNSCPDGWNCQLGIVETGNVLYYGGSPQVSIYAGTWRLVSTYPVTDAVKQPCQFLAKSQEEGRNSVPQWTITAGNFSCP